MEYHNISAREVRELAYGENPWQTPAKQFETGSEDPLAPHNFELIAGESPGPSYNNLIDIDRALQTITHIAAAFDVNRVSGINVALAVKHGNPCGAAVSPKKSSRKLIPGMISGDPRAIFGGVVMTNFQVDKEQAGSLLYNQMPEGQRRILDAVIAPSFTNEAVTILERRRGRCKLFVNPALANLNRDSLDTTSRFRYIRGGFLEQPNYTYVLDLQDPRLEKTKEVSEWLENEALIAWAIGSTSNSNTITIVSNGTLLGNGVGQQDRVGACELAVKKAEPNDGSTGTVAYSDSFFPFIDGPEVLADAGIDFILTSSGSIRDEEVKSFCRDRNIALYLIPDKIGRGFFGH